MTLRTSIVKMLDKFMYFREYILPRWTEKCYTQFLFISTFNVTFYILESEVASLCKIDRYSSDANTKVYRDVHVFLSISFRMSKASINTKAAMTKQTLQIHSVFSHVGP